MDGRGRCDGATDGGPAAAAPPPPDPPRGSTSRLALLKTFKFAIRDEAPKILRLDARRVAEGPVAAQAAELGDLELGGEDGVRVVLLLARELRGDAVDVLAVDLGRDEAVDGRLVEFHGRDARELLVDDAQGGLQVLLRQLEGQFVLELPRERRRLLELPPERPDLLGRRAGRPRDGGGAVGRAGEGLLAAKGGLAAQASGAPRVVLHGAPRRRRPVAARPDLGRKRVIQRRFNVAVPRARVPKKDVHGRDRSER